MTLKEKRKAYHLFKPQTDLYVLKADGSPRINGAGMSLGFKRHQGTDYLSLWL